MSVEFGVWQIDGQRTTPVDFVSIGLEARLEELLAADITIASPAWLVIGRQVRTTHGKRIDLLAIDADGKLIAIEIKRDQTPRDVVAQVLDYGSFVRTLQDGQIAEIFQKYQRDFFPGRPEQSLDEAFKSRFGLKKMPDELNAEHELVIVAQSLDAETERIVQYLAEEYEVRINAIFFRVFESDGKQFLTRAWLQDEPELQDDDAKPNPRHERIEWNGEFYVNYSRDRNWEAAMKYGFVSASGEWYLKTFKSLEPGNRIWVNVPGEGYVGVGTVEAAPVMGHAFTVTEAGREISVTDVLPHLAEQKSFQDPLNAEHFARVKWIKTVPVQNAIGERGFFGNQNTVVRPRDIKWAFTIDRLKQKFDVT